MGSSCDKPCPVQIAVDGYTLPIYYNANASKPKPN